MIRTGLYSLSAAVALTSNAFLISLLLFPDPAPAHSHTRSKSTHESLDQRNIRLLKDSLLHLPPDLHSPAGEAARFKRRALNGHVQKPSPFDPALMAPQNRSHFVDTESSSLATDVEKTNHGRTRKRDVFAQTNYFASDRETHTSLLDPKLALPIANCRETPRYAATHGRNAMRSNAWELISQGLGQDTHGTYLDWAPRPDLTNLGSLHEISVFSTKERQSD